jgi:hypothetical protein
MNSSGDAPVAPAPSPTARIADAAWFNALWFQATWFCAVLGRDALLPLTAGMILLHLALSRDLKSELFQLSAVALVGITVDASLSAGGFYLFEDGVLVPLWLCCLWLAFATTLRRSLAFFGPRPALTALAGAVVLPFNYLVGARLGAVEFGHALPLTFVVVGLVWALLLPLLYRIAAVAHTTGKP